MFAPTVAQGPQEVDAFEQARSGLWDLEAELIPRDAFDPGLRVLVCAYVHRDPQEVLAERTSSCVPEGALLSDKVPDVFLVLGSEESEINAAGVRLCDAGFAESVFMTKVPRAPSVAQGTHAVLGEPTDTMRAHDDADAFARRGIDGRDHVFVQNGLTTSTVRVFTEDTSFSGDIDFARSWEDAEAPSMDLVVFTGRIEARVHALTSVQKTGIMINVSRVEPTIEWNVRKVDLQELLDLHAGVPGRVARFAEGVEVPMAAFGSV